LASCSAHPLPLAATRFLTSPFQYIKMDTAAARARMKARMGGKSSRTGGKGSVRRKKKAVHKTTSTDEKRLQATLKRLNVNNIPAIEEVNLFKDNGTVIHFDAPKVQASIAANTYVISGQCATKNLQELLPGIINQLGPDNLQNLKKIAESYSGNGEGGDDDDDDDDDIPDLVENFDDAAEK
jgi:nascent polypeptide-associated complex subunit beta